MTSLNWRSLFRYFIRIGDCLSQLLNVAVFFGENANESVSGRAYRMRRIGWQWAALRQIINIIFFWQQDHCRNSYMADIARARRTLREYGGI